MNRPTLPAFFCAALFLLSTVGPSAAAARADAGSIKGTVRATAGAANSPRTPVSGARLTLANRDLPNRLLKVATDEAGEFIFKDLPAATYVLTVEAPGLSPVTREIHLEDGANLTVEIELTATVAESITVSDEEGLVSTAETTTSNIVRAPTLKNVPLRAENYQSALPLTPGVVRDTAGEDHIKGARAGQSAYTVNGADVTDPVTGKLAFNVPIEAAASVQIEENPYNAEFGRLTGGATNLETKSGDNHFKFTAARFFPTFRYILTGPIDSFRPRVTFSGPVVRDRLFFLQSFEYRFTRTRLSALPSGKNDTTLEDFDSFSQLDLTVNKTNRLKFVGTFFPQKVRHAGLDTFNPQETTPNVKQRGTLFSVAEQAIFGDASFLSSELSYKTFDTDVFPQGAQPLTLQPDGNTGNYFAETHRQSRRVQWQETYYAAPLKLGGRHSIKAGAEFDWTSVKARFHDNSILIRRGNNTLAQRIDFTGPSGADFRVNELAAFVQDRWEVSRKLTIDQGLRLDRDGIASRADFAPRFSFLFLPFKSDRTMIRGGVGLFYDRMPLYVGYFTSGLTALPRRIVTRFAPDGVTVTDGPRLFGNELLSPLRDPRSVRWSAQLDQSLTKNLTLRVGYLQRTTTANLLVEPVASGANAGALVLDNAGRSRYRELQLLAIYRNPRWGDWNASYVWSRARGDLNAADYFLGDLPAFVIRPNQFGPLAFDAPHRFLLYGQRNLPHDINVSPVLEIHSGFPFSAVNDQLDFVGARGEAGRFPLFFSLDTQVTKGFHIPKFEKHKMRVGVAVFNITGHFNPRDVQNNLGSTNFGQFFNTQGTSVRGKFEVDF